MSFENQCTGLACSAYLLASSPDPVLPIKICKEVHLADHIVHGLLQIGIAKRAADRIASKLEGVRSSGKAIDMEEEFRLLTLQVIGEAVLSLPPEECDRVCLCSLLASMTLLAGHLI